jgi:hypothetical protein
MLESIRLQGACGRRLRRGQGILQTNLICLIPRDLWRQGDHPLPESLVGTAGSRQVHIHFEATPKKNEMKRCSQSSSSWRAALSRSSRIITKVIARSEDFPTRITRMRRDRIDYGHLRFRKCVIKYYACTYTCRLQFTMLYNDLSIAYLN